MEAFRLEGNSETPLTTYWGAKIAVSMMNPFRTRLMTRTPTERYERENEDLPC